MPVALLAEGVDRNKRFMGENDTGPWVALLAEGVDRNLNIWVAHASLSTVALLAEGVDRNIMDTVIDNTSVRSPSSRRAWIEIVLEIVGCLYLTWSPSSRRAWIEICLTHIFYSSLICRPPRGGRG